MTLQIAKIVIDLRMRKSPGIRTYLGSVVPKIARFLDAFDFTLIVDNESRRLAQFERLNASFVEFSSPPCSLTEQIEFIQLRKSVPSLFLAPHYNCPMFAGNPKIVVIHDCRHIQPNLRSNYLDMAYMKLMYRYLARSGAHLIFVSETIRREFFKFVGEVSGETHVIHNGIEHATWKKLGITYRKDPIFVFVGKNRTYKNCRSILLAANEIYSKLFFKIVFVGRGFEKLKEEIVLYYPHLSSRVDFFDYLPQLELVRLLSSAQALVFPSRYEGFGLPPLEAMATGCPVIATRIPAINEVCKNAPLYVDDPDNIHELANRMLELARSQKLVRECITRGLQISDGFSWDKSALALAGVIRDLKPS